MAVAYAQESSFSRSLSRIEPFITKQQLHFLESKFELEMFEPIHFYKRPDFSIHYKPTNNIVDVSLVIINFNKEKFLKRALESALAQTYDRMEVVVADDCSTDRSLSLVQNILKEAQDQNSISKQIHRVKIVGN